MKTVTQMTNMELGQEFITLKHFHDSLITFIPQDEQTQLLLKVVTSDRVNVKIEMVKRWEIAA